VAEVSAKAVKELREQTGAGMMDCKRALADAVGDAAKAVELLRERGLAKAVKRAGRETSEGTIAITLDAATAGIVELGCETDFVAKTDDFQALATALAGVAASAADGAGPDALLEANIDGEKVSEKLASAVSRLGENVVLKRAERLAVPGAGTSGGYVHAGGKLGVIVGLATEADAEKAGGLAKDLAMHVAAADPSPLAVDRDGVPSELIEKEAELFRRQATQEGKPEKVIEKIVEGRIRKYYAEVCLLEQPFVKDPDKTIGQVLADAESQLGKPVGVAGFVRFRLGETASE
jgi:elongation factor Ts